MSSVSPLRTKILCICYALPVALLTPVLAASDIDDLLAPSKDGVKLVDQGATEAWNGVVDAFRRNDLAKAKELGAAFMAADHKTSPYQVLGVRVMMDLANAENPSVTRDVGLSGEMKRLMSERDALRAKFADLQRIAQAADARINKLTNNRTQAVQAGTAAHRECVRAAQELDQANAAMEAMKPEIAANKEKVGKVEVGASQNLKNDTLQLLDMLVEAGEIEAAFAITNVFVRVAGSDLDVAKKQQDVIRLREDQQKAEKLVAAITAEIDPLIIMGKGAEAQTKLDTILAKIEASDQSQSVKRMTFSKLKALGIRIASARNGETRRAEQEEKEQDAQRNDRMAAASEISERLKELEQKLDAAQTTFGTMIRSIDGFAEYSGDFAAESDKQKMAASLKEKIKSGQVSKEKLDNMIKAKAEHVGILREVEILQSDTSGLSVVQKGRLANLDATARTALDLLRQATL